MQPFQLFNEKLSSPQINGHGKKKSGLTNSTISLVSTPSRKAFYKRSFLSNLTFTLTATGSKSKLRFLTSNIIFISSVSKRYIGKRSLSSSIIFVQAASQKRVFNKIISSNIILTSNLISFKRHLLNINHSLNIINTFSKNLIHIQHVSQSIHFVDEAIKEWTKKPKDTLIFISTITIKHIINCSLISNFSFISSLSKRFICKRILNNNLSFVQTVLPIKVKKRSLISNIIFSQSATNNRVSKFVDPENNLLLIDHLIVRKIYHKFISQNLSFVQNLNKNNRYNFNLDTLLIFRQTTTNGLIEVIPVEDLIGSGGIDLKSESKNCYEVSNQCHAEGFETIAGLSFPCTIVNGQSAIISDYNASDFYQGCILGLYNLSGGTDKTNELKISASTVSLLNSNKDTLITFPYIVTDHTRGFISLIADWASHSEGYKTIASGPASHSGGIGAIADLPTKFARSDNIDSQFSIISLSGITKNAILTPLLIRGQDSFKIRNNRTYSLFIHIAGRNLDGSEHAYFIRQGMIHNENGILSFVGSIGTVGSDINNPDWAISITADTVLKISVVGANSKTIKWIARVDCLEL